MKTLEREENACRKIPDHIEQSRCSLAEEVSRSSKLDQTVGKNWTDVYSLPGRVTQGLSQIEIILHFTFIKGYFP